MLVVTHLAQVAAVADAQIAVTKAVVDGETTARAEPVGGDRRVAEVARMLSGDAGGAAASAERHAMRFLHRGGRGPASRRVAEAGVILLSRAETHLRDWWGRQFARQGPHRFLARSPAQAAGLRVTLQKLDPYINVDPGR